MLKEAIIICSLNFLSRKRQNIKLHIKYFVNGILIQLLEKIRRPMVSRYSSNIIYKHVIQNNINYFWNEIVYISVYHKHTARKLLLHVFTGEQQWQKDVGLEAANIRMNPANTTLCDIGEAVSCSSYVIYLLHRHPTETILSENVHSDLNSSGKRGSS